MRARLAIVDDSPAFRAAAAALLGSDGFDVVGTASDGLSGLALARAARPDVVVLDVALPDLDGFEVAARLRALEVAPRVVLVSSRDWADLDSRIAACGAAGFLAKDAVDGAAVAALVAR